MSPLHKDMAWLDGEPKTPPVPSEVRIEAGYLFRLLQSGILLKLPQSRPMPAIGRNCHELRIDGCNETWRFFYFIDTDAIVSIGSFNKKVQKTPVREIELCKKRLRAYIENKGGSK